MVSRQNIGNFQADLIVENLIILELKAARNIDDAHKAQLLNYLRTTEKEIGLILNFGPRPEFKRLAFDKIRKDSRKKTSMVDGLFD